MKHINDFKQFLMNEVNLNQSRINILEEKINSIKSLLKDSFFGYRKVEKQGSFALETIIKPVQEHNEFDADILIYLVKDDDKDPVDYINGLYDFFKGNQNYTHMVKRKTRCITLDYAGDFHLDLVPCIEVGDDIFICNQKENRFERTDGTGYRQWLGDKTSCTGGELKRVTRLMKFMRDHKGNFSVKSILLTTLLGRCVDDLSKMDFVDIPTSLLNITQVLNKFLQNHPEMPIITNPVLPGENFNRHWDQTKYSNFRDKIRIYYGKIEDAFFDEDHNSSIRKWRKIFGEKFGTLKEKKGNYGYEIKPKKPYYWS